MDNRTVLAVLLSLMVWYGWLWMFPPPMPEILEEGSVTEAGAADGAPAASASPAEDPPAAAAAADPRAGPIRAERFSLCSVEGEVTTEDGSLRDAVLVDHKARYQVQPLYSWVLSGMSEPWNPYGDDPGPVPLIGPTGHGWTAGAGQGSVTAPYNEVTVSPDRIVTRARTEDGLKIVRTFTASGGDPCVITLAVEWTNTSSATFDGELWVATHDVMAVNGGRYDSPMRPEAWVGGSLEREEDPDLTVPVTTLEGPVGWLGVADTYFGMYAVPDATDGVARFTTLTRGLEQEAGVQYVLSGPLPAGSSRALELKIYTGTKDLDRLRSVDPLLGEAVQLGFFAALAYPLLLLMRELHGVIGDWALTIIALTFIIKLVFFPLTQRSFRSSQSMQAIQPELTALREKFKDDPEQLNKATIGLFQERGVNPLGGCLPMVLQMPVWFALYSVIWNSVELYHVEFGYLQDLTTADPYLLLPGCVMGLMVLQQQFVPTGNMDPAQAKMMKLMPLMIGFLFFALPAGLMLYIFMNTLLSILQQAYIKRTFPGNQPQATAQGDSPPES